MNMNSKRLVITIALGLAVLALAAGSVLQFMSDKRKVKIHYSHNESAGKYVSLVNFYVYPISDGGKSKIDQAIRGYRDGTISFGSVREVISKELPREVEGEKVPIKNGQEAEVLLQRGPYIILHFSKDGSWAKTINAGSEALELDISKDAL